MRREPFAVSCFVQAMTSDAREQKSAAALALLIAERLGDVPAYYVAVRPDGNNGDWSAEMNGSEDVVAAYEPKLDAICDDLRRRYALAD